MVKVGGSSTPPGDASGSDDSPVYARSDSGGHSLPDVDADKGLIDEARKLINSQRQQCEWGRGARGRACRWARGLAGTPCVCQRWRRRVPPTDRLESIRPAAPDQPAAPSSIHFHFYPPAGKEETVGWTWYTWLAFYVPFLGW